MKYHLSSLILWLSPCLGQALMEQTAGRDPLFSDVRWVTERDDANSLDPDFLYVGSAETVLAHAGRAPEVWFLTSAVRGNCCERILSAPEVGEGGLPLYQTLRQAFFELNQWIIGLDAAVVQGEGVQSLITLSQSILKNPMVVFDSSFFVLAATDNLKPTDVPLYEVVQTGEADPETILKLQTIKRSPLLPLGGGFSYQSTTEICSMEELFIHIEGQSGTLLARFNVRCSCQPVTKGLKRLLVILLTRLKVVLERQPPAQTIRDLDDYLFRQLMEGAGDVEKISEVLGIPLHGEYSVACLCIEGYDSIKIITLASQIERVVPLSRPFLHENQLLVFLRVNSTNRGTSIFWEYQQQRITEISEILDLHVGLSDLFFSLEHLKLYCGQAMAAMQAAIRKDREHWNLCPREGYNAHVCQYREIAIYDLVGRLLEKIPPEGIGTPTYWTMREHDRQRNGNDCAVLKIYLENDCQAVASAEVLHMHRNSVVYRINKMVDSYDLDLNDPQFKLLFLMSAVADEMWGKE